MASRRSSSNTAEPTSSRSRAASQVLPTRPNRGGPAVPAGRDRGPTARWCLRPLADAPPGLSSSNPKRSRTGPEGQELQHRVHVEPTGHQLEQRRGRAQHRIGGPDRAVGQPVPQCRCTVSWDDRGGPGRSPRIGGNRVVAGAELPNAASISGAKRSSAGHRRPDVVLGEVRPGSGQQVEQGVPQDLDLTDGPEAGVELHRVVTGVVGQAGPGGRLARRSCCSRPSSVLGGSATGPSSTRSTGTPSASTSASCRAVSRWRRPQLRSSGWWANEVAVSLDRSRTDPCRRSGRLASNSPGSRWVGSSMKTWTSRVAATALGHVEEVAGRAGGEPEEHQTTAAGRRRSSPAWRRSKDGRQALGWAGLIDPVPDPAPQSGLPDAVLVQIAALCRRRTGPGPTAGPCGGGAGGSDRTGRRCDGPLA